MKCLVAVVAIAAFAGAELLPSNSYLPPSPVSRSTGYVQGPQPTPPFPGPPQVIAARNIDPTTLGRGNGVSRSGPHAPSVQARLGVGSPGHEDNSVSLGPNDVDIGARVSYEADKRGFNPQVSYHDMEDLTRSEGYDINAKPRNINGYKSGANGYQNGVNGYKNGANGYQNGANGYQNGGKGYKNGGYEDTRSY